MSLVGIDVAGSADELVGAAAILIAALGYAIGPMILKRHLSDLDPRASMAATLAIAALVVLGVAFLDERPGVGAIAGLLLILAGSWLATGGRIPGRGVAAPG